MARSTLHMKLLEEVQLKLQFQSVLSFTKELSALVFILGITVKYFSMWLSVVLRRDLSKSPLQKSLSFYSRH